MSRSTKRPNEPRGPGQTTFQRYEPTQGTIDFTEARLIKLARESLSPTRQLKIRELLQGYKAQVFRVAWKDGEPIYVPVLADSE
jgi:hypothetical protein